MASHIGWGTSGLGKPPVLQVNNLEGVDYRLPNNSTGAGLAFLDVTNGPSGMSFNSKKFCFFVGKSKSKNLLGFELDSDGFHVYLFISMKGKIC